MNSMELERSRSINFFLAPGKLTFSLHVTIYSDRKVIREMSVIDDSSCRIRNFQCPFTDNVQDSYAVDFGLGQGGKQVK